MPDGRSKTRSTARWDGLSVRRNRRSARSAEKQDRAIDKVDHVLGALLRQAETGGGGVKATRLSDLVSIRGRFHRSVSLTRDWQRGVDLSEYVVTPTIKEIARRIVDELEHPNGARAWSITGPYGSGKSAFGLFLADLLAADECSHPESEVLRKGRKLLKRPFVPVLIVAERAPLAQSVIKGLSDGLRTIAPSFSRRLVDAQRDRGLSGGELSQLAVEAAESACDKGYGGLLLILDELGKFLEFAASDQ